MTALGLVASAVYLTWRAGFTMHDTPLWLSVPTFALEVLAFIGALALTWALWPAPTRGIDEISDDADATLVAASTIGLDPVDVVLRVDRQELHEVRATLLALRSVRHTGTVRIVDLRARETLVPLAHEFDAEYLVAERFDRHGLATVMSRIATPVTFPRPTSWDGWRTISAIRGSPSSRDRAAASPRRRPATGPIGAAT